MISISAPAKINLFLHILGRRPDGYHNLQTVFQFLDLCDELEFSAIKASSSANIELCNTLKDVPMKENLIWKAARALQIASGTKHGAKIKLHKVLPIGAGIGGGSSDAATTLMALNHVWQTGLSLDALATIGATLGADVPVFIHGTSAFAEGIGEALQTVELPEPWFLLIKPACGVSTKQIFCHQELTRNTSPITIAAFLSGTSKTHNDCLPVVQKVYPEIEQAMSWLRGFAKPRLTGTGACIFAEFADKHEAEQVKVHVPEQWQAFVTKGCNRSPAHKQLEALKSAN